MGWSNLDDQIHQQLWIPPGFAHGFQALTDEAVVHYKCSENLWSPENEVTVRFNDSKIGIEWPLTVTRTHIRDKNAPLLESLEILPKFEDCLSHVRH